MNNKSLVLLVTIFALVALSIAAGLKVPLKARQTRLMTKLGNNRYPLQGNLTYWGEFFATVGLGTPPQYVQLQVDTGSTDLIVYGPGCGSGCGNPKNVYDESQSSTSNQVTCDDDNYYCNQDDCNDDPEGPCDWNDQYGDGSSIDGHLDQDVFTIGSLTTQSRVSIGVIDTVDAPNGFEATGVDGIWGFAYESLSGWQGDSVFSHIVGDTGMYDSFSLCLYENNGVLEMGTDYSKDKRFVWTPVQQDQWYTVYIYDIKLGNTSIGISAWDLNWNGVIVDSGTTLLIVSTQIMTAIQNQITSLCAKTPLVGVCGVPSNQTLFDGLCYPMTTAQVNQFPTLSIKFETAGYLSILPQDYLWQGAGIPGTYCMGIQAMDGGLPVIIGDVFMQRYHVVFDKYWDRIGFGPLSSCPKLYKSFAFHGLRKKPRSPNQQFPKMTTNTVLAFAILFIATSYGREYVTYYYSATAGCPNDVTNAPVKISQATGVCMLRFPASGSRIFSCNSTGIYETICTDKACSVSCTITSVAKDSCATTPYGSFFQTCGQGAVDGSYAPSFVGSQYEDGACGDPNGPAAVYVAQLDTCIGPYATFVQNFGQVYSCVSSEVQYKNCSSSDCSSGCGSLVPYPSGCQTTARNLVSGSSVGTCSSTSSPSGSQPSTSAPSAQTPSGATPVAQGPSGSQQSPSASPSASPTAKSPQTKSSSAYVAVPSLALALVSLL